MFMNYCTYACRVLIFLVIVFMVGFVMVKNEKRIEKFVAERINGAPIASDPRTAQTQRETIVTVFRNYLERDPTDEEVEMFSRVMRNPSDVISVVDAVRALDEYKQLAARGVDVSTDEVLKVSEISNSPLIRDLQKVDMDTRMETYRNIIDIYQRILERMPTNKELTYYAHRLLTDTTFTLEKLERVLEGSNEYKILEKNQKNTVNAELPGKITDAQLTFDVINKYKSVFKKDPNQDTLDFLKAKYLSYKLDEAKFNKLLMLIYYMDSAGGSEGTSNNRAQIAQVLEEFGATGTQDTRSQQQSQVVNKSVITTNSTSNTQSTNLTTSTSSGTQQNGTPQSSQSSKTSTNSASAHTQESTPQGPSSETAACKPRYEDPFYNSLASAQSSQGSQSSSQQPGAAGAIRGSCQFNGDIEVNRDKLAEFQFSRYNDELNNMCRNSYIKEYDAKVYKSITKDPKDFKAAPLVYSTEPADASPLEEARNTMIGSILPPFIYKETTSTSF